VSLLSVPGALKAVELLVELVLVGLAAILIAEALVGLWKTRRKKTPRRSIVAEVVKSGLEVVAAPMAVLELVGRTEALRLTVTAGVAPWLESCPLVVPALLN